MARRKDDDADDDDDDDDDVLRNTTKTMVRCFYLCCICTYIFDDRTKVWSLLDLDNYAKTWRSLV